jgi:ADP-dependent NAD(P)H-hydrate dehydratase
MKLPSFPRRAGDAHKGDFGKILIVGGSRAMPGAAALAGAAALRSGAGLVKIALPLSAITPVAAFCPCCTFLPCAETADGSLAEEALKPILVAAEESDVLALGPGLSTSPETARLAIKIMYHTSLPLVVDADGLNILTLEPSVIQKRHGLSVLTPHPGEFARLAKTKRPPLAERRIDAAAELAKRLRAIVLLKGAGTVVTDGERSHVVTTGNPGMATAGSGDVLTGTLAALLHLFDDPLGATALAAHIHGAAGDIATEKLGQTAVTAVDILDNLSGAINAATKGAKKKTVRKK